jgi:hypothetical protein
MGGARYITLVLVTVCRSRMVPPSQSDLVFHSDQIEARKPIDKIIAERKCLLLWSPMKYKKIASS